MNIKELIKEWILTYSSKKSFFSSKKIERAFSFKSALLIIWIWFIVKLFCLVDCDLTATDILLVVTPLLGYGGYAMLRTEKSKLTTPTNEAN